MVNEWVLILTFVFPNNNNPKIEKIKCADIPCIADVEHLAYIDPNVARFQLFAPGTYAPLDSGAYIWPPLKDVWKM